jgi:hypothetical protein
MTILPTIANATSRRVRLNTCGLALCILLASCASVPEKTVSLDGINFATAPPTEILDLLRRADGIIVNTVVDHENRDPGAWPVYIRGCNGGKKYSDIMRREDHCFAVFSVLYNQALMGPPNNPALLATISALLRGCGVYANIASEAERGRTCGYLGQLLFEIGNAESARTVWEEAPGCYSEESRTGLPVNGCVPVMLSFGNMNYIGSPDLKPRANVQIDGIYKSDPQRLTAIMMKSCNTVHDEGSCSFLRSRGVKVDMTAVASAQAEYHEAVQASRERNLAAAAKDQADSENRRNALLGALQSMPGASNPNAIIDAGNQQPAAIRAIGDANAARQQQATQMRLASQQLPLQPTGQGTNIVAGPATTYTSLQPVATSSQGTQSSVNNSLAGAGLPNSPVGSSAIEYSTPLATSCVRQFWDPDNYNWLSFENNCGQAIYVNYIPHRPGGWAMGGGMNLAPGNHNNTGLSSADINQTGGFDLYVCPTDSVPVDLSGKVFNVNVAQYRCKP